MDATAQPDWVEWADTPRAEDWKAVALSLGIDPHGMRHHPQSWMAGGVGGPYFRPETFPTDAVKQEFERRLRIVRANAGAGGAIEGNALANGGYIVNLRSFLAWARTRWSVPHEWAAAIGHVMRLPGADTRLIRNLAAEERKTAAPAGQAATVAGTTQPAHDWKEQAREIAKAKLAEHRAMPNGGIQGKLATYAAHVEKELRQRGIHGPRGLLTAGNIQREALQGKYWWNGGNPKD